MPTNITIRNIVFSINLNTLLSGLLFRTVLTVVPYFQTQTEIANSVATRLEDNREKKLPANLSSVASDPISKA